MKSLDSSSEYDSSSLSDSASLGDIERQYEGQPMRAYSSNQSLRQLKKDLAKQVKELGEDHIDNAKLHYSIGGLRNIKGENKKSIESYWATINILEKVDNDYSKRNIKTVYCKIGKVLAILEEYDDAIKAYKRAISINKKIYGKDNSDISSIYCMIGTLMSKKNE